MAVGQDYNPYESNSINSAGVSGAYNRFKEPGELTQQDAMTIFVLEEELAKNKNLTDPRKGKIEQELLKLREKERFKENKEATANFHMGEGFKKVGKVKDEIRGIEKELTTGNLPEADRRQKIEKLKELRKSELPIDDEQFKVLLKDIINQVKHPALKKFITEQCIFDFDPKATSELTVDPLTTPGKFTLTINPDTLYDVSSSQIKDQFGIERQWRLFNPAKMAFLLGQALGHIFIEPDNWKEVSPKIQITVGGRTGSWEDFVGLCVSNPDKAGKLSPEAYQYFRKILNGIRDRSIKISKDKKSFPAPQFELDTRSESAKTNGITKQEAPKRNFLISFTKKLGYSDVDKDSFALKMGKIKKLLWKKTDWYQRALAEYESKEVSRIKTRQEGIVDRDKSLKQLLNNGTENIGSEERFMLRTILLADMEFEDFSNERMHVYLQACDHKYRESNGEEINEESYNFIVRLHRNSNAKGRRGTKPCEYRKVEIGEVYSTYDPKTGTYSDKVATSEVYVRKSRHKLMDDVLEEVNTFSGREISNVSKEFLEYLKIGDRHIEIDETWGKEQQSKYQQFDKENKYKCATGDWRNIVGDEFADKMLDNYNNRGDIPKLNPDQIAIIARVIAEELKVETGKKFFPKAPQTILYREHAKGALVEAYHYYKPKFLVDDTYRGYINYFLHTSGLEVNSHGDIDRIAVKGDDDNEKLNNFIESEINNKDHDYTCDDARKVLEEYNDLEQEEKPAWEKDVQGNIKDVSANKLKREFIEKRNKQEAAKDIGKLEEAMDKYILKIVEVIGKTNLPEELKEAIRDTALVSNDVFILNDIKDRISKYNTGLLSSDEIYKNNQIIQETVLNLRPYRRELIKIKGLLGNLGFEYLGNQETTQKLPNYSKEYGVQIESGRNFQKDALGKDRIAKALEAKKELMDADKIKMLSGDEKAKYNELKEKLVQINGKIKQLAKDKTKTGELEEAQKELIAINQEIKPYTERMGGTSGKGITVELQEDIIATIKNIDSIIASIDSYRTAINKESDDQATKKFKNLFNLIPTEIIDEAKNPEGKYDKEKIIMALKYASVFIEKRIVDAETVSTKAKKGKEKEKNDKEER